MGLNPQRLEEPMTHAWAAQLGSTSAELRGPPGGGRQLPKFVDGLQDMSVALRTNWLLNAAKWLQLI